MKYKIILFLFLVFFLLYLYLSYLNPEKVGFNFGGPKPIEMPVADFVVLSFAAGVLITLIGGFFYDIKRSVIGWRKKRVEKEKGEYIEAIERAKAYDLKGEREKAIENIKRLISKSPELEEPYLYLADLYISMKEYKGAIDTLNLAEMKFGMKEPIVLKKAKVRQAIKEFHNMEEDLKQVLKMNESNLEAITMLRDYYIMQKDWEKAYDMQQRLKRYVRTEEEEKRLLGIRYERQKAILNEGANIDYEMIIKELKDIIGVDKRFIPAYILLEEVYKRMGKLNEAGRVLGRGYTKTGHIIFLLKMEDLYIERGEPGVILKIYRRVLDISMKNYLVSFLYARLCLRLEMVDEAIETLNMLLMEGVDFKGLHKAMAEAYIHRGETEKAIEEFRKAFPPEHVYIPFVCSHCQAKKAEWSEFCGSCNSWDTINVRKEDFVQTESSELRMFYEAEDWID